MFSVGEGGAWQARLLGQHGDGSQKTTAESLH